MGVLYVFEVFVGEGEGDGGDECLWSVWVSGELGGIVRRDVY